MQALKVQRSAAAVQALMDARKKKKPRELGKKETTIEQHVVDYAWDTYGIEAIKMNTFGHTNLPDRLFLIHGGRPLWIEFKKQGKEPTAIQAHTMQELDRWGYDVEVCDNREMGRAIIDTYADRAGIKAIGTVAKSSKVGAKNLPDARGKVRAQARLCSNMGRPRSR